MLVIEVRVEGALYRQALYNRDGHCRERVRLAAAQLGGCRVQALGVDGPVEPVGVRELLAHEGVAHGDREHLVQDTVDTVVGGHLLLPLEQPPGAVGTLEVVEDLLDRVPVRVLEQAVHERRQETGLAAEVIGDESPVRTRDPLDLCHREPGVALIGHDRSGGVEYSAPLSAQAPTHCRRESDFSSALLVGSLRAGDSVTRKLNHTINLLLAQTVVNRTDTNVALAPRRPRTSGRLLSRRRSPVVSRRACCGLTAACAVPVRTRQGRRRSSQMTREPSELSVRW